MQFVIIIAALAAVAIAAPQYADSKASRFEGSPEVVPILRDDRVQEDDGTYNLDVETGNSIVLSESGSPTGPEGAVVKAGEYYYTAPDGTPVRVTWIADENGFQPQSDLLPVAPEFPHPIPDFVKQQVEFAAQEDAARARAESNGSSARYNAP